GERSWINCRAIGFSVLEATNACRMRRKRGELRLVFFLATVFFPAGFFLVVEVLLLCAEDRAVQTEPSSTNARSESPRIRRKDRTTTDIHRRKLAPIIEASSSARLRTNSWLK